MKKTKIYFRKTYGNVELVPEKPIITVPDKTLQDQINELKEQQKDMAENQEELNIRLEEFIQEILNEHPTWIYTDGVVYDEGGQVKFVTNGTVDVA